MTHWHQLSPEQALKQLEADPRGLGDDEAGRRLEQHGPNELVEVVARGPWRILWEQVSGALVIMLVVAAVVSLFLDELTDAIVILAIVVLNSVLGFVQDYRAEKALAALKQLAVPHVRVRRQGAVRDLSARDLVPGDIVLLETGNFVPADGRLLESANLRVQEAALTGESEAVEKTIAALPGDNIPLGDRRNLVYMGTVVSYGHAVCLIVETGMHTELGRIAHSLQTVEPEPTPLQKRLAQLGRTLALAALAIVLVVFLMGLWRGEDVKLMLMTAMSLAVAVVPEGLPAVATVALALGARRMFQRQALIRKLPAVETLGSVTVICTDKTGTLTENRMAVTVLDVAGDRIELTEKLRRGRPDLEAGNSHLAALKQQVAEKQALALLLAGAALCNDAELQTDGDEGGARAVGDPTETALVVAAAQLGLPKERLDALFPRVAEVPFDSERKRMSTLHAVHKSDGAAAGPLAALASLLTSTHVAFTKGAVDGLLEACTHVWDGGQATALDDQWRQRIKQGNDQLAAGGMRVLGGALRTLRDLPATIDAPSVEAELTFVGLFGIIDPPRPEVAEAVARCRSAGIRPVMITGDHPLTALAIAKQLQIAEGAARVLSGPDMEGTSAADLARLVEEVSVFARVAPKHKLQLVQALQKNGHVVAMTGDGVNDAPALKQAHIGVAMGLAGTDVAKEAAQMVLLDDNFATIVNAVEEGRVVYDNIRKFLRYALTGNVGEIWVMVLGPLVGMPLALLPLQILWINLVTDGLPGLALSVEPGERDTMRRPPYPPDGHIVNRNLSFDILLIGLLIGVVSLAMGYWYWLQGAEEVHWRTIVFTVLTLAQMGHVMAIRSSRDSLFSLGVFSNPYLVWSVLLTFALQLAVIYVPFMQDVFKTTALSLPEFLECLALASVVFWAVEAQKWWLRRRDQSEHHIAQV